MKITAVINTLNEENNLRWCLETVKWCDEIIVVDMESDDKTVEVAQEFTNKIFTFPRSGYVEPARQFAVSKASGDWILLLDADEMIPKSLANTLMKIIHNNVADIVEIPIKHYIMGDWIRYSGWGNSIQKKLFKKHTITFSHIIHKGLINNSPAKCIQLESNDSNYIWHFSYLDSNHFVAKLNRYTDVEAIHLYDQHVKFSYFLLIKSFIREFLGRFIVCKGYKDGVRGFSLSLMMGFYKALTCIKLWEHCQYDQTTQEEVYNKIKTDLLVKWLDNSN